MKRNIELPQLVQELQAENLKKLDIVIPSSCISMKEGRIIVNNCVDNTELGKILHETGIDQSSEDGAHHISLQCLDTMNSHLADKLGIPSRYYQRMAGEALPLLDSNVSHWLSKQNTNYLLRTFIDRKEENGVARALLSDRFRTLDNYDILMAVLQAINESGLDIKIDEGGCDISDKRLYMRFICPSIEISAPELLRNYRPGGKPNQTGDGIISGFVVSNSEVGAGALSIAARAKILACSNGMIRTDEKFSQRHLGAKMEEFSSVDWSQETKQKNLELIIAQIRDTIKHFVSEDFLGKHIAKVINKGKEEIVHPADCIKAVTTSLAIGEEKGNEILNLFLKSGDMTAFGISQAITLFAHTQDNADTQYELENASVSVLDNIKEFDKPLAKKSNKTAAQLN